MDNLQPLDYEELVKRVEQIYADFDTQIAQIKKARDARIMQIFKNAELQKRSFLRKKIFDVSNKELT